LAACDQSENAPHKSDVYLLSRFHEAARSSQNRGPQSARSYRTRKIRTLRIAMKRTSRTPTAILVVSSAIVLRSPTDVAITNTSATIATTRERMRPPACGGALLVRIDLLKFAPSSGNLCF